MEKSRGKFASFQLLLAKLPPCRWKFSLILYCNFFPLSLWVSRLFSAKINPIYCWQEVLQLIEKTCKAEFIYAAHFIKQLDTWLDKWWLDNELLRCKCWWQINNLTGRGCFRRREKVYVCESKFFVVNLSGTRKRKFIFNVKKAVQGLATAREM